MINNSKSTATEEHKVPRGGFLASFHTFDSLKVRNYRMLWLSQLGSNLGQQMDSVARGWLMYQITGSALQLGLVMAARGLPTLVFGVVAGALADRGSRKAQLIAAQTTNSVLSITLATLVLTGNVMPWHVYVSAVLAGSFQAFQQPARQALISDIVGNRYLLNALALNSATNSLARALGPSIAGILIAIAGVQGAYYTEAGCYIFASFWVLKLIVPKREERAAASREGFLASMGSGLAFVASRKYIRVLIILALGPLVLGMPYTTLMPIFAKDVLHGGASLQGFLLSSVGVGAFAAAFTVASLPRRNGYGLPEKNVVGDQQRSHSEMH